MRAKIFTFGILFVVVGLGLGISYVMAPPSAVAACSKDC